MNSLVRSDAARSELRLAGDGRRPVRWRARVVRDVLSLRLALQALAAVLAADCRWRWWEKASGRAGPVVTAGPDGVFFEALSADGSAHAVVAMGPSMLELEGAPAFGTTALDFTAGLAAGLAELRSGREAWLAVEPGADAAGEPPVEWLRALLQVQEALALPGTRLSVRPVSLLGVVRFLQAVKRDAAPRAMRYEFEPERPARLVLEPWQQVIELKGATHRYTERRVIRTWGRRRLALLGPLLPYADCVDVYLKGRAMPSFYRVRLPGVVFQLGLSGWTDQGWLTGRFGAAGRFEQEDAARLPGALEYLSAARRANVDETAAALGADWETAQRLLNRLCRRGRAIYELEDRRYRHRELFAEPVDEARVFGPDERGLRARQLALAGKVRVKESRASEFRKTRRFASPRLHDAVVREVVFNDWRVEGEVDGRPAEVVVGETGRIVFGRCGCAFFQEHLLNRGPCEHLLALVEAGEPWRGQGAINEAPPNEAG